LPQAAAHDAGTPPADFIARANGAASTGDDCGSGIVSVPGEIVALPC